MARLAAWLTAALATAGSVSVSVSAFPTPENIAKMARRNGAAGFGVGSLEDLTEKLARMREEQRLVKRDASPVDVSGEHAFVPPGNDDQRGPCPGLNALANHNYISHDGVVSLIDQISAAVSVFNFGVDLASVLAILSVLFVGNPLSLSPSYSIGGPTPTVSNVLDNLGGLLGTPMGLDHSHNIIESDASMTRDDIYQTGDCWTLNLDFFTELYESIQGDALTREEVADFALRRYEYSVANNPYFWNGPVTNVMMRPVGYVLVNDVLANHTEDNPDENTDKEVLKSFYSITENENGTLSYTPGHERIPANWYARTTPYTILSFNAAEVSLLAKQPTLLSIGGNTGTVNSFTGLDISNLTGGVLNAATLLEGNNLMCFVLEVVKFAAPNALSTVLKTLEAPVELLAEAVAPILDLDCPVFEDLTAGGTDFWTYAMETFPGANMSGSAL